jgi:hypothetical protein
MIHIRTLRDLHRAEVYEAPPLPSLSNQSVPAPYFPTLKRFAGVIAEFHFVGNGRSPRQSFTGVRDRSAASDRRRVNLPLNSRYQIIKGGAPVRILGERFACPAHFSSRAALPEPTPGTSPPAAADSNQAHHLQKLRQRYANSLRSLQPLPWAQAPLA